MDGERDATLLAKRLTNGLQTQFAKYMLCNETPRRLTAIITSMSSSAPSDRAYIDFLTEMSFAADYYQESSLFSLCIKTLLAYRISWTVFPTIFSCVCKLAADNLPEPNTVIAKSLQVHDILLLIFITNIRIGSNVSIFTSPN
jgi:hypothetical protein